MSLCLILPHSCSTHYITIPIGVEEHPDSVCRCSLNFQRGTWSRFWYLEVVQLWETDRVLSSEIWKVCDILYCMGFLADMREGLLVLRL